MADNALKRRNALMDASQGVSKGFWADGLGGPVDMMTTLANLGIAGGGYAGHKLGLLSQPPELIQNPVGGSEWIAQKMRSNGLLNDNPGSTADAYGRVAGGLLAPLTAARAPQIANALQQAPEAIARAATPKYVAMGGGVTGRQGGAVNFSGPQSEALRIAQANAAKPIAEGGLGLHPNNTPMERARAMGFETAPSKELYHSARGDWASNEIDPSMSDLGFHVGTLEQAQSRAKAFGSQGVNYGEGANVMPVLMDKYANMLKLKDVGTFHADGIAPQLEKKGLMSKGKGKAIEKAIDADWRLRQQYDDQMRAILRQNDYNGVKYANEQEGAGNSYAITDPTSVRSRFAAFDPFRRNSGNILAGIGAGGLGVASLLDERKGR